MLSRAGLAPTRPCTQQNHLNHITRWEQGLPAMAAELSSDTYADLAMIKPVSLAASNRIATNFDVGVWLPSPVLSNGTRGFTSG